MSEPSTQSSSKGSPITDEYAASGFFVLRTPLIPFDDFLAWGADGGHPPSPDDGAPRSDRSSLIRGLRALAECPHVREALEVATPDLGQALDSWLTGSAPIPSRLESALVRYLARMSGRPTPFGLFAGWSVGTLAETTQLRLPARREYRRHARVDGGWLSSFVAALEKNPAIRSELRYGPNECLYRVGDQWRYPETRMRAGLTPHFLVAVDDDEALRGTIERSRGGASREALADALVKQHEVTREEAESYVDELIDGQILVSDFRVLLTGGEALEDALRRLRAIPSANEYVGLLEPIQAELEALHCVAVGDCPPDRHRALNRRLSELHSAEDVRVPVRMELHKPAVGLSLGADVVREVLRGIECLYSLFGRPSSDKALTAFREAFRDRFGDQEVPLLRALDDEIGPSFGEKPVSSANTSPLLAAIGLEPSAKPAEIRWEREYGVILRELTQMLKDGRTEIQLDPEKLPSTRTGEGARLPDAFCAVLALAARDDEAVHRGEFEIVLRFLSGPSGARMLGRFCSLDDAMHHHVRAHLQAEEDLDPQAIHAELVHLPSPTMVHVMARPVLREFEIPLLGRSGAPTSRQLALEDLTLSVVGDRLVLRSSKHRREVRIHMSTAHNFTGRGMTVYKFLGALQTQGVRPSLQWIWGPLQNATFLPRVRCGRVVLSVARWRFEAADIRRLWPSSGEPIPDEVRRWREAWRIPRHVALVQGADQELPVDLDNASSVAGFLDTTRKLSRVVFQEMYPGPGTLCVKGPEGSFVHEIQLPFVRRRTALAGVPERLSDAADPAAHPANGDPQREWLYAKFYIAESAADRVLRRLVQPLVARVEHEGWSDRWFFIRYRDPGFHLRVRFHGSAEVLRDRVLPALFEASKSLRGDGFLWRLELDSYQPEYARYHGPAGVALAERVFHADSEAALALMGMTSGDSGSEARWPMVLLGMDRLLTDLGIDLPAKAALLARQAERMARRMNVGKSLKVRAADFFRTRQRPLAAMLENGATSEANAPFGPVLEKRSNRIAAIVEANPDPEARRLLRLSAHDYLHLSVNRMLRCSILHQETILYDFLRRIYESRLARQR